MGRDILEFSEPTPLDRLGLGDASIDAAASIPPMVDDPSSTPPPHRGTLNLAVAVVGLAVAAAVGYLLWSTSGRPDLVVNDRPIANPDEILAAADDLFRRTAEADGAPVADGASCFFGPGNNEPRVLCGPVWLGISPEDEAWLEVDTAYSFVDDGAVGEAGDVRDTATVESRTLVRPDGARPIDVGRPARPTGGPRRANGARLLDPGAVLSEAEAALRDELATSGDGTPLNLAEEATCFLQVGPEVIHGLPATADTVWCGPARAVDSSPDQVWIPISIG